MSKMIVTTETLRKMAQYIEGTQPVVRGHEELQTKLSAAIPVAVDAMVANGFVAPAMREAKIAALIANPAGLADELAKVAADGARKPLGEPASVKAASRVRTADEVFVDRLMR